MLGGNFHAETPSCDCTQCRFPFVSTLWCFFWRNPILPSVIVRVLGAGCWAEIFIGFFRRGGGVIVRVLGAGCCLSDFSSAEEVQSFGCWVLGGIFHAETPSCDCSQCRFPFVSTSWCFWRNPILPSRRCWRVLAGAGCCVCVCVPVGVCVRLRLHQNTDWGFAKVSY